jgi:hypothetical protein
MLAAAPRILGLSMTGAATLGARQTSLTTQPCADAGFDV